MKPNALKALRVAATLSILAGASGLLIAGTDLLTKTIIEQNRIANIKKNLSKVFPDAGFGDGVKLSGGDYLTDYYPASLHDGEDGRVYACSGTNQYGGVSILIGVYSDFTLGKMVVLENSESYGSTLQSNYLDKYDAANDGASREEALYDVDCGATYGATLVRDMVLEAVSHYKEGK